jgi:alkanesulfonate monooxygenase SsuD/methylene tetrahydromethanopterin reductase-like flavin-dependent oxidoreductase (luciferase family)
VATIKVGISDQDAFTTPDPRIRRRLLDQIAAASRLPARTPPSHAGRAAARPLVRRLLAGEEVSHQGEFFSLEEARILPPPLPAIPIVIGGKGEAAIRRAATLGDGWLGMFCSARRFAQTRSRIIAATADLGRESPSWFGVTVWCGLDADPERGHEMLAAKIERLYRLPYEKFRYLAPAGTPKQVAEFLRPFAESGAGHVTLVPAGKSVEAEIDAVAEVRERLRALA